MSTIDNPERQRMKLLRNIRGGEHFTERRTNQIPKWEFLKIQEHQSIKTHFQKH